MSNILLTMAIWGSVPHDTSGIFVLMFIFYTIEGYYLQNGFKTLADLLASIIIANGGGRSMKVCEVFAENQNVRHVTLTSGEQFTAEYLFQISAHIIFMENL